MAIKFYICLITFLSLVFIAGNYCMQNKVYNPTSDKNKDPYFYGKIRKKLGCYYDGPSKVYEVQEGFNNFFWVSIRDVKHFYTAQGNYYQTEIVKSWYYSPCTLNCLITCTALYGIYTLYKKYKI